MTITIMTWRQSPPSSNYNSPNNWTPAAVPNTDRVAAVFGASATTAVSIAANVDVGEWVFTPGSSQYTFHITGSTEVDFFGGGIIVNGGSASITVELDSALIFNNTSTAGSASIKVNNALEFFQFSTAGNASITNNLGVLFAEYSTAGSAMIDTSTGGTTQFNDFSTGGNAQMITAAGGHVDFSYSVGPAGNDALTAGSIAGAGAYYLGGDTLTVGSNNLSTIVSGPVQDGGGHRGSHASLVKVGHGKLVLSHANNTYLGGTMLEAGTFEVAAIGAAGTGAITFAGKADLAIDEAALSGHHFANSIDAFGKDDVLDLRGLRFHASATARYHKATHHLTVHSGSITDTLTLLSPHGTSFDVVSDGHGGAKVTLASPIAHVTAMVAGPSAHGLGVSPSATDHLLHA